MSKGITDAQKAKERLWTEADFSKRGSIKSIRLMDRDNNYCCSPGDKSKSKIIPIYGEADIEFDDGVRASIPCTLKEAQEYYIGQKARVELITEDDTDNDDDD